jgi:hypothetical protein
MESKAGKERPSKNNLSRDTHCITNVTLNKMHYCEVIRKRES